VLHSPTELSGTSEVSVAELAQVVADGGRRPTEGFRDTSGRPCGLTKELQGDISCRGPPVKDSRLFVLPEFRIFGHEKDYLVASGTVEPDESIVLDQSGYVVDGRSGGQLATICDLALVQSGAAANRIEDLGSFSEALGPDILSVWISTARHGRGLRFRDDSSPTGETRTPGLRGRRRSPIWIESISSVHRLTSDLARPSPFHPSLIASSALRA
jgi:hypothetical protein